ncbi:MAG: GH32 C-terminal domain-containing protein [Haloarculaceae archaeon]
MTETSVGVGFVVDGDPSAEQRAAREWAREQSFRVETVRSAALIADDLDDFDVVWWHRDAPADDVAGPFVDALESYAVGGGGLLLSLRAMELVDALGVDPVAPDAVGTEEIAEPTGLLWKRLHDDHPAVAAFDRLRIPLCDRGSVPFARYEAVLPQEGEVLAATVRGDRDLPRQTSVVSWQVGNGAVLGVGAPLTFRDPAGESVAADRSAFARDLVTALAAGPDERYARATTGDDVATMRRRLDDRNRPDYHVTPPANWLNDPNGLVEWNGRYHLFYQYNPGGPYHHTIHWGHAVSDDLVEWRDEPVALTPSPDGPDRDGCWSGCAVDDDGTPTILYTGGRDRAQLPCLATTDDSDLRTWKKHADNPVIEEPPTDLDVLETEHWDAEFRDHCVWREGGRWHQLIGTGVADVGGAVLLYTSDDLREWDYEGPVLVGDWGESGSVWECPELLDLGGKHLLHVSNYEDVIGFVGTYADGTFDVDRRVILDHGDYYAPQSLRDGDRSLTWGWLPEARDLEAQWNAGWSGAMSLPRVLDRGPDDRLRQRPAPELDALRERTLVGDATVTLDDERHALDASGRRLELALTVALDDAEAVELAVLESSDGEERTPIRYTADSEVVVERAAASRDPEATTDPQRMPVTPYDDPLSLRAFVDGSVVELYANERHCLTSRVYPTRADSVGVSLTAEGGRATVAGLSVWELGSAWDAQSEATGRSRVSPER